MVNGKMLQVDIFILFHLYLMVNTALTGFLFLFSQVFLEYSSFQSGILADVLLSLFTGGHRRRVVTPDTVFNTK